MTKHQWLTSTDPHAMLRAIDPTLTRIWKKGDPEPWRAWSDRKARLYCCACCLARGTSVETVNRYEKKGMHDGDNRVNDIAWAYHWTEEGENNPPMGYRADLLRDIFGNPWHKVEMPTRLGVREIPVVIHEIECKGVTFYCPWLTWRDGLIPQMAQNIYDNRRFEELPILADALEEAGCVADTKCPECSGSERDNTGIKWCQTCSGTGVVSPILTHLRAPCPYCKDAKFLTGDVGARVGAGLGDKTRETEYQQRFAKSFNRRCVCKGTRLATHVRGCWVLDLLLGKE